MASLRIIQPGLMSTVQDLGRFGHSSLGVPESGALDRLSLRAGNRLLGNPDNAAAIEMTISGGEFLFDDDAMITLTGATMPGRLNTAQGTQRDAPHATPVAIRAGELLALGRATTGCRAYLCARGGIDVPPVLASRSTCLPGGFGGIDGRALRAGDVLRIGSADRFAPSCPCPPESAAWLREQTSRPVIRIVRSVHAESIRGAFDQMVSSEFRASPNSDRGGLRLAGARIESRNGGLMISEGTLLGAIQLPEGGEPIILLNDRPTTGGYPMIACVIGADIAAVAQIIPGAPLRFKEVSIESARGAWRDQQSKLHRLFKPHANIEADG